MGLLLDNPATGTPIDIRQGTRKFVWESHVIYYRVVTEGLQIVPVLHQSMDVGRHVST